jgi:hypothetical protein
MKVLATVENGALIPEEPLRFSRSKVEIEIPDDAIDQINGAPEPATLRSEVKPAEFSQTNAHVTPPNPPPAPYNLPPEAAAYAADLLERLDRIRSATAPADSELPPLSQQQLDRFEAFALREEFRNGR